MKEILNVQQVVVRHLILLCNLKSFTSCQNDEWSPQTG